MHMHRHKRGICAHWFRLTVLLNLVTLLLCNATKVGNVEWRVINLYEVDSFCVFASIDVFTHQRNRLTLECYLHRIEELTQQPSLYLFQLFFSAGCTIFFSLSFRLHDFTTFSSVFRCCGFSSEDENISCLSLVVCPGASFVHDISNPVCTVWSCYSVVNSETLIPYPSLRDIRRPHRKNSFQ